MADTTLAPARDPAGDPEAHLAAFRDYARRVSQLTPTEAPPPVPPRGPSDPLARDHGLTPTEAPPPVPPRGPESPVPPLGPPSPSASTAPPSPPPVLAPVLTGEAAPAPPPLFALRPPPEPSPSERAREWLERLRDDPRAGALVLLLLALAAGLVWYRMGLSAEGNAAAPPTTRVAAASGRPGHAASAVVVHVAGAVARPGVYRLPTGARVSQAIDAAGGPGEGAQLDRLNLAATLTDGQQVYVPRPDDPLPAGDGGTTAAGSPVGRAPLNLNLATPSELEDLPGIGPTLAAAIVREREARGGFRSVDDLLGVRGIGERRLEDIRPYVTV